jgi:O-antigen ligase
MIRTEIQSPSSLRFQPVPMARWLLVGAFLGLLITPPVSNLFQLLLVALFIVSGELRRRLVANWRQPLVFGALAFFAMVALAAVYSAAPPREALAAVITWRKLLFVPLAMALFDEPAAKRQFALSLVAGTLVLALVSFGGFAIGWGARADDFPGIVARNHGTQGMVFGAAAFVAGVLGMQATDRRWRTGLLAAAAVLALNVVVVGAARSGYLVLLACIAAYAANHAWHSKRGVAGTLATTAVAVVLAAGALVASPQSRERIVQAVQEALHYQDSQTLTSMGIRQIFWRNTVGIIAQRPVFGWGTGSFVHVYTDVVKDRPGVAGTITVDPHNQYMKIAAEQGLVGLVVFLGLLWSATRQRASAPWRLLGLAGLVGWCLTSLASSHFATFAEGTFIYIWIGAMLGADHGERSAPPRPA